MVTGERTIAFYDPNHVQFTYDLVLLGQLNRAPSITTVPVVEAYVGRDYRYDADAADPDDDTVTFSLQTRPANLSVDPSTGKLSWSPAAVNKGSHSVVLRVQDGRGGWSEQQYVVSVIEPPPNRPPYFTSVPVVDVQVSAPTRTTPMPSTPIATSSPTLSSMRPMECRLIVHRSDSMDSDSGATAGRWTARPDRHRTSRDVRLRYHRVRRRDGPSRVVVCSDRRTVCRP